MSLFEYRCHLSETVRKMFVNSTKTSVLVMHNTVPDVLSSLINIRHRQGEAAIMNQKRKVLSVWGKHDLFLHLMAFPRYPSH